MFNGTVKNDGPGKVYTRVYAHLDSEKPTFYRFYGTALNYEDIDWDGKVSGAAKTKEVNY